MTFREQVVAVATGGVSPFALSVIEFIKQHPWLDVAMKGIIGATAGLLATETLKYIQRKLKNKKPKQ